MADNTGAAETASPPRTRFGAAHTFALLAVIIAAVLVILPPPGGATALTMRAAGAVVLAIGLWSTGVVPAYFTSLVFLFVTVTFAIAPANIVFSGFHSGAIWLVFGGLVLGLGAEKSGLGARLAHSLLSRLPQSYFVIVCGIMAVALVLDFLIPSAAGRVTLLIPIVLVLADRLGFRPNGRGYNGLVLTGMLGSTIPAVAILTANVPNMGLYGAAESIYGIRLTYADYFVLNFPVLGVAAVLAYPVLIWLLFRERPEMPDATEDSGAWNSAERRLTIIVLAALALWVTDFAHGISPAWVALGAALLCVTPRVGLLPFQALVRDINYGPILFLAGIIGLGAVANHSGLGRVVADGLLAVVDLRQGADVRNFAAIVGIGSIVAIFSTLPASPSIMVPLAETIAEATGWSLLSVLNVQVATWNIFPFPYQAPPLVISIALAGLRLGPPLRLLLAYAAFAVVVVLPLHFLWGRWLGYFS